VNYLVSVLVLIAQCCITTAAVDLPTYASTECTPPTNIDEILSSPPSKQQCMCGLTFAELGEAAMRNMQAEEAADRSSNQEPEVPEIGVKAAAAASYGPNSGSGSGSGDGTG
jgi:hypothetical protein